MFGLYLTLAYTVPNIYVFFRIMFLFIGRRYRMLYTVIYLLAAAVFPATRYLSHLFSDSVLEVLTSVAHYLLPFYLYVFLGLLLYELILLFNRLFIFIPKEVRKSPGYRFYALLSIILLSFTVVVAGVINLNTIRTSHYRITVPKKDSTIDKLRVTFVADFHLMQNSSLSYVKQFVRKANATNPDIMLYGGDIVEGRDDDKIPETVLVALRGVQSKYGSYGVPGNHESYGSSGEGTFYKGAGITLLHDTLLNIHDAFFLAGRNDERYRNRKRVDDILKQHNINMPVIMLDHRPTQLQEVSRTTVDVQLSGHTHNGQLFPINLYMKSLYDLSWGHRQINNTHFFVTSGLRLWGPPVKTVGKSEIVVVDIDFH